MIATVLKGGYVKRGPKIITYRDYNRFSTIDFRNHLFYMIAHELSENGDYGAFEAVVMAVLNEHAPVKRKYIRANDGPFMTKALRKKICIELSFVIDTTIIELRKTAKHIKSRGTNA